MATSGIAKTIRRRIDSSINRISLQSQTIHAKPVLHHMLFGLFPLSFKLDSTRESSMHAGLDGLAAELWLRSH